MAPLVSFLLFLLLLPSSAWQPNASHFLFIMFDDLRPELSVYGNQHMITPNFERLARKSVVFDYAFCQIAVCNPSRDSLLTGLRPDTVGTYGFQWSFRPNMIFPSLFSAAGYKTAGYGKILHWDGPDKEIWNYDQWENNWYEYQNEEWGCMNSSTMPDKIKPEEEFRDYQFTSRAIETMKTLHSEQQYFMVGLGFKLPHLQMHMPYKYFDMYRNKRHMWKRHRKDLKYPNSAPIVAHKCCALKKFQYMNEEGGKRFIRDESIGRRINQPISQQMHTELSWGYAAAISFLDEQLGRILDFIDETALWDNLTIVLTSDHGMHNGEKGIWQKWTTFDESTRVPLMISHPNSQVQGTHFSDPVELIDIFPTLLDLLPIAPQKKPCNKLFRDISLCQPFQGKSLAPVVLGRAVDHDTSPSAQYHARARSLMTSTQQKKSSNARNNNKKGTSVAPLVSLAGSSRPLHASGVPSSAPFAVSQCWKCALRSSLARLQGLNRTADKRAEMNPFYDCPRKLPKRPQQELSLMGYSFRSSEYRYTLWLHWDRVKHLPLLSLPPFAQELYDHRGEVLENFTRLEMVNVAREGGFGQVLQEWRLRALRFLAHEVQFHGPYP